MRHQALAHRSSYAGRRTVLSTAYFVASARVDPASFQTGVSAGCGAPPWSGAPWWNDPSAVSSYSTPSNVRSSTSPRRRHPPARPAPSLTETMEGPGTAGRNLCRALMKLFRGDMF